MMNIGRYPLLMLVVGILATDIGVAEITEVIDGVIPVVSRGSNGQLTPESKRFAKIMRSTAERNGYVTLWLTANTPFNPYPNQDTGSQIATQNARVQAVFGEVLQPLIDRGLVWHPPNGPMVQGPGCIVRATAKGVQRLVQDSRILHIVAMAHAD